MFIRGVIEGRAILVQIMMNKADSVHRHIYATLGGDELYYVVRVWYKWVYLTFNGMLRNTLRPTINGFIAHLSHRYVYNWFLTPMGSNTPNVQMGQTQKGLAITRSPKITGYRQWHNSDNACVDQTLHPMAKRGVLSYMIALKRDCTEVSDVFH